LVSGFRYYDEERDARFRRAAFAPSFPSAVRVFLGRFATVRFRFAVAAAFLIFLRAAVFCFVVAIVVVLSWRNPR
jgi:hypothetical protein